MDGIDPISVKLTVSAVRIKADGSREDLGELLLAPAETLEEEQWPEQ